MWLRSVKKEKIRLALSEQLDLGSPLIHWRVVHDDETRSALYVQGEKSLHCAGALIYLEKRERPHQMMRISERLGMYDYTQLDMTADVR